MALRGHSAGPDTWGQILRLAFSHFQGIGYGRRNLGLAAPPVHRARFRSWQPLCRTPGGRPREVPPGRIRQLGQLVEWRCADTTCPAFLPWVCCKASALRRVGRSRVDRVDGFRISTTGLLGAIDSVCLGEASLANRRFPIVHGTQVLCRPERYCQKDRGCAHELGSSAVGRSITETSFATLDFHHF